MYTAPEQFAAANKAAVDALLTVANTALASAERVAALNLNVARTALEDSAAGAKTLLAAKDVQELVAAQSALAQPGVEKAVAYSRSVYEISSEARQNFAALVEAQFGEFKKSVGQLFEQATTRAPAGSEVAVAAMRSAFAAANSAFDSLSRSAKEVANVAESNLTAASEATVKAVTATAAAGKKK